MNECSMRARKKRKRENLQLIVIAIITIVTGTGVVFVVSAIIVLRIFVSPIIESFIDEPRSVFIKVGHVVEKNAV